MKVSREQAAENRSRVVEVAGRLFRERGWVDALDPDDVSSDTLAEAIAKGLRRDPSVRARCRPDLGGLSAAVEQLVSLLRTVGLEQRLAPIAE